MHNQKTVLITGGAGFIGSHVVDLLVKQGYNIRVLDNLTSGSLSNISEHFSQGRIDFVKGDIRDSSVLERSLNGIDMVVHLAALISVPQSFSDPVTTLDVNLSGTLNVLKCSVSKNIEKLIFVSSCAVYGESTVLPVNEEGNIHPISPYAESKLLGERYCLGFSERNLLQTNVLRFFNVYGCRQKLNDYSGVITQFIDRIQNNKPLIVYGNGLQTRDFVNVIDIAKGIIACLQNDKLDGHVYNLGSGIPTSINLLAETLLDLADINLPIEHLPPRSGDIYQSYADISKAKQYLNFSPTIDLNDGLRALLRERGVING